MICMNAKGESTKNKVCLTSVALMRRIQYTNSEISRVEENNTAYDNIKIIFLNKAGNKCMIYL